MVGTRLAESGIVSGTDACGQPDAALVVEHRVVDVGLAIPDLFISPIGRRRGNVIVLGGRSCGIAHLRLDLAPGVTHGIKGWNEIRTFLGRAVESSSGVEPRI